jgi:hypothetical protein
MLVKEAIEALQELDFNQEIAIAWWTKDFVENMEDALITDDQWVRIVYDLDEEEYCWGCVNDSLADYVRQELEYK